MGESGEMVSVTWVPFWSLMAAFPLHLHWFTSSMRGMMKRRNGVALKERKILSLQVSPGTQTFSTDGFTSDIVHVSTALSALESSPRPRPILDSITARLRTLPHITAVPPLLFLQPSTSLGSLSAALSPNHAALETAGSPYAAGRTRTTIQQSLEQGVRDYFTTASAQVTTVWTEGRVIMRANEGGEELKRFGGRMRRRFVSGIKGTTGDDRAMVQAI